MAAGAGCSASSPLTSGECTNLISAQPKLQVRVTGLPTSLTDSGYAVGTPGKSTVVVHCQNTCKYTKCLFSSIPIPF